MTIREKTNTREVQKPFLTGAAFDERTLINGLKMFGAVLLVLFVSLIVSLTASFDNGILKTLINASVIILALIIFFNNGSKKGTEDVARGEILWQKQQNNKPFSDSERSLCFHPLKGYLIGLIGLIPLFIIALILALNTTVKTTESGALPSWMQAYISRSDIGDALVNYTNPQGMLLIDYLRAAVRLMILPFINIAGSSNNNILLLIERLSPLIILLPAAAYGTGYLTGRKIRTQVHTAISESERKRKRKEQKRQKSRNRPVQNREPEQLN